MKIIYTFAFFFLNIFFFSISAQEIKINQSAQIKELMEVKKEFGQLEKTFQVQIYTGNITEAEEVLKKASEMYKLPVMKVFETPNYKIRIGKYRSRIEAEKALTKIRVDYPASFVIAPF